MQMNEQPRTLGQIAFEVHCQSLGIPALWNDLPDRVQAAWNETAVVIQYAHHFMNVVEHPDISATTFICTHTWVQADGVTHCSHCGKIKGEVINETITDSIGISSKLGKGGTG